MFAWTYRDDSGHEVRRSPRFSDTDAAEDWIGSSWPQLLENGVLAVILVDEERGKQLYRMGLDAG